MDRGREPTGFEGYTAVALLLAAVCVLALGLLIVSAFFSSIAQIYAPDAWSSSAQVEWAGTSLP